MQTCKTCPSYLSDDNEIMLRFGKTVGAPMCGRYGHVLGRPGLDSEQTEMQFAMTCDSHGVALAEVPVSITPRVADPDPSVLAKGATKAEIFTCSRCVNYVDHEVVANDFNWAAGMCRAKGTLVLQPRKECRSCPWASEGQPSRTTMGLELRAEYNMGFTVKTETAMKALVGEGYPDPHTYASEIEVAAEDKEWCRAWFSVPNPNNPSDVKYLPTFRLEYFSDEDRKIIPMTGDDHHPELYVDHQHLLWQFASDVYTLDEPLCLVGPAGAGKSEFGRFVAWRMGLPYRRLQVRENTDAETFIGHPDFKNNETTFTYGRLPRAWSSPGILLVDEPNRGPEDIRDMLRPLTDNAKELVLDADRGQIVERNPFCFMMLAINPAWDYKNIGTNEMADADIDRLSFAWVDYPPEPILRHIIVERCKTLDDFDIPDHVLDKMMKVTADIRAAVEQGRFPKSWGPRMDVKVARKMAHYPFAEAYMKACLNYVEPRTRDIVLQSIATVDDSATKYLQDAIEDDAF